MRPVDEVADVVADRRCAPTVPDDRKLFVLGEISSEEGVIDVMEGRMPALMVALRASIVVDVAGWTTIL